MEGKKKGEKERKVDGGGKERKEGESHNAGKNINMILFLSFFFFYLTFQHLSP